MRLCRCYAPFSALSLGSNRAVHVHYNRLVQERGVPNVDSMNVLVGGYRSGWEGKTWSYLTELQPTSVHEGVGDEVMGPRDSRPPWLGGNGKVPVAKIGPDAVPALVGG